MFRFPFGSIPPSYREFWVKSGDGSSEPSGERQTKKTEAETKIEKEGRLRACEVFRTGRTKKLREKGTSWRFPLTCEREVRR